MLQPDPNKILLAPDFNLFGRLVGRSLLLLFSHANTKIIALCVCQEKKKQKRKACILNWLSQFSVGQDTKMVYAHITVLSYEWVYGLESWTEPDQNPMFSSNHSFRNKKFKSYFWLHNFQIVSKSQIYCLKAVATLLQSKCQLCSALYISFIFLCFIFLSYIKFSIT